MDWKFFKAFNPYFFVQANKLFQKASSPMWNILIWNIFLGRKYCYNKHKFNDTCEFKSYNKVAFRLESF